MGSTNFTPPPPPDMADPPPRKKHVHMYAAYQWLNGDCDEKIDIALHQDKRVVELGR
jgi:hypothetical protein